MQFTPEKELCFTYQQDKHSKASLTLKNTSKEPIYFKFKVSTPNKFAIKPSVGQLSPGAQTFVVINIHKQIAGQAQRERVICSYGPKYEESKQFNIVVVQAQNKLNFTHLLSQKQSRVAQLQKEVQNYKSSPITMQPVAKASKPILLWAIVGIIGIAVGYVMPVQLFA